MNICVCKHINQTDKKGIFYYFRSGLDHDLVTSMFSLKRAGLELSLSNQKLTATDETTVHAMKLLTCLLYNAKSIIRSISCKSNTAEA